MKNYRGFKNELSLDGLGFGTSAINGSVALPGGFYAPYNPPTVYSTPAPTAAPAPVSPTPTGYAPPSLLGPTGGLLQFQPVGVFQGEGPAGKLFPYQPDVDDMAPENGIPGVDDSFGVPSRTQETAAEKTKTNRGLVLAAIAAFLLFGG